MNRPFYETDDETALVGKTVRLTHSEDGHAHQARVEEVDAMWHAARITLANGSERWVLVDELEIVHPSHHRRRDE
jgi:hypothetical protein